MMNTSEKRIALDEALLKVKSGDIIIPAIGACQPSGFLGRIHEVDKRVSNVMIYNALEFETFPYQDPALEIDNISSICFFFGQGSRKLHTVGRSSLLPCHLRNFSRYGLKYKKPNIFVGSVTPMDRFGYFTMSMSMVYERQFMDAADIVILEVNDQMPRIYGDTLIHVDEVDFYYEHSHPLVAAEPMAPGEKEQKIGAYIADLVNDGDTIQLGIGGIPNAVAQSLMGKKDLGIHTEMYTECMMELTKSGVVTNRKKKLHRGKSVAAFAFGSQDLYDFLDQNPGVAIMEGAYVNNPVVISQNDNMVSINTTLEVDLTGQCCSESIGTKQYSGIGGQTDTVLGAMMSKNGRSIIALTSTTKDEKISKIKPFLTPGSAVSLSRNDVDYVVTEYGVASLWGMTIAERAENLINVAHPKFRDELRRSAEEYQIW